MEIIDYTCDLMRRKDWHIMLEIICIIGTILFIIAMFIIFSIGEEDINVLIKIVKLEYLLATPISLYMWIHESVKAGKWFVYKRSLPFVLVIMLLGYAIMILLIWWIYKRKSLNKKWPTYIEDERYYSLEDSLLSLLSFSILTIPIFTIGTIIITVKGLK